MTYTLQPADSQEFARWWAIYRNSNEDFSQGITEQADEITRIPFCHWIMQGEERVGGIIHLRENVGDFFLITPHTNAYHILKAALPAEIENARNILDEHVHAFQMLGFRSVESRRWMLRPTKPYPNVDFGEFRRSVPDESHAAAIARLMYDAFHGGIGQYGERDIPAHRASVDNYFETITGGDVCHQASSVLFDGERMIAACLVQPYKSHASIRFVVTHPHYQGRGLARRLMHYAIDTVCDTSPTVTLAVTVGNPAEALYHHMGFVPGVITHTLTR